MNETVTSKKIELLRKLKEHKDVLTVQQFRTIRGQVRAGDTDGALKGLETILRRQKGAKA